MKLLQFILLSFLIINSQLSMGTESDSSTYGDLYLMDEVSSAKRNFNVALSYSNETSNTFQNINEAVLSADYLLQSYFSVGIQGSLSTSSDRSLNNDIREKLAESGYRQKFYKPKNTYLAMLGLRPLSGRLNFFQVDTVPFEVWAKVGYGRVYYDNPDVDYEILAWQLNMNTFVTRNFGLQIGIGQEIENLISSETEKLAKFKVRAGCLLKF